MKALGWIVSFLILAGFLNLIDFHVCIKAPGQCRRAAQLGN
jgi:hypothetical protein